MSSEIENGFVALIGQFMADSRDGRNQHEILGDTLLLLLGLFSEPTAYTSKGTVPIDWIEYLLLQFPPSSRLLNGSEPRVVVRPGCAVRRSIDRKGRIGLERIDWPLVNDVGAFPPRKYDVCLSFSGEQRSFARQLTAAMKSCELRVFFDEDEKFKLLGADLFKRLYSIYAVESHYCVILFSRSYRERAWTNHELRAAQSRTLKERQDYVLPIIFDDEVLPPEFENISYLRAENVDAAAISKAISERIHARLERHWFTEKELVQVIESDIFLSCLTDSLKNELAQLASKDERALAAATVATIAIFPFGRLRPCLQGLLKHLLFTFPPVASLFSDEKFQFASSNVHVMRFIANDGVIVLPREWSDELVIKLKKTYEALEARATK